MSCSKRSSHRYRETIKSPDTIPFKIPYKKYVDNLLSMITKAHTTSILHQLEYLRKELSTPAFWILLSLLTKELNSAAWREVVDKQDKQAARRKKSKRMNKWQTPSEVDIDHCCRIIFYYIVSVINKYKIPNIENVWNEILGNSLTENKEFYEYLYKNKINIPDKICKLFSQKLNSFYSSQSGAVKIKLIGLGFIFDGMITTRTSIKHLEKLYFKLKQREKTNKMIKPENFISFMNTPEKLSLFLSHFPDYDINQVDKKTDLNVLEQLINMKTYFYFSRVDTSNLVSHSFLLPHRFTHRTRLPPSQASRNECHPNEIVKYRVARIINLLQQLISRGAQLSKPVYSGTFNRAVDQQHFFTTSLGIYVLISLNMNDLYLRKSSLQCDNDLVLFIIKYIKRFGSEFQDFILHHLTLTYSIIHKPEFIIQKRENEDEQEQQINDKLFQRSLKLKEWCRLKIKDNCSQKDIKKLGLSESLVNYCSFGFFELNYPLQCIREVVRHKGNAKPKEIQHANGNIITMDIESSDDEEMMYNDEGDYSEMSVNSGNNIGDFSCVLF